MSFFFFIVLLFLPLASVIYLICNRRHQLEVWLLFSVITSLLFYLVMMITVKCVRIEGNRNIAKYDLDGDGFYSQEGLTLEAEAALDDWASDTGLNLAPITGLFVAPIYSGFWHLIVGVPFLLIANRTNKSRKGEQVDGHQQI